MSSHDGSLVGARCEAVRSGAMEGREPSDPGYDDWFDEPEPPTETQGDARSSYDADDEVWVLPEDEEPRLTARREIVVAGRTLTMAQVAIIAGSFIVLLIAILAAAGVFSSNKSTAPPVTTPTTPPPAKTATQATTTTTPTTQAPSQTLSPGATGSEVKTLQQALKALGYDPGTPDGTYGPSTEAAVKAFQTANGLTADGVVGPATLAKLQQALSG
jgi:Putative peptidoglycan binding domain